MRTDADMTGRRIKKLMNYAIKNFFASAIGKNEVQSGKIMVKEVKKGRNIDLPDGRIYIMI